MEKVRVAVVGGGRMGAPLIADLMSRPFVEFIAVCDVNIESRGATLARDNGIFVTGDVQELAAMGEDIDIIIEVSGDPEVKPQLKNAFILSGNRSTIIMHDLIARMMLSIMGDAEDLVATVHPDDRGIG